MRRALGLAALRVMAAVNFVWELTTKQRQKRLAALEERRRKAEFDRQDREYEPKDSGPRPVYLKEEVPLDRPSWQERIAADEDHE